VAFSLPPMNSFYKTEAAILSLQALLPEGFLFGKFNLRIYDEPYITSV